MISLSFSTQNSEVAALFKRSFARLFIALLALAACAPLRQGPGPATAPPRLTSLAYVTADGLALPLREYLPPGMPRAVILALHGFGDYNHAFDIAARQWRIAGIATYAYDQRGFGASPQAGIFAGEAAMVGDAATAANLLRRNYPGVPVYILGESMGGAVAILVAAEADPPPVAGYILVSPATWGRDNMDLSDRLILSLSDAVIPGATLSLPQELQGDYLPTDDVHMMRSLSLDPLVQKQERVDMVAGATGLMGDAYAQAPALGPNVLVMFGRHDEILPEDVIAAFLKRLHGPRIALYDQGYHLLLRDLERQPAIEDIEAWVLNPAAPLPSGADHNTEWYAAARP
jgi:alpha-beta hydrolase superfamily lysophospholipase